MQTTPLKAAENTETAGRLITDEIFMKGFASAHEAGRRVKGSANGSFDCMELEERFWSRSDVWQLLERKKPLVA